MEYEDLSPNEKKALEPCISVEILCNGKVHYRRPKDHSHTLETAYLIATGKAPAYTIKEIEKEHDWQEGKFEESGSWIYYYECQQCGMMLDRYSYRRIEAMKVES